MPRYGDSTSGIIAFTLLPHGIEIEFRDGKRYRYDQITPGRDHVLAMEQLAVSGHGLTTYINQHIRGQFATKLKPHRRRTP